MCVFETVSRIITNHTIKQYPCLFFRTLKSLLMMTFKESFEISDFISLTIIYVEMLLTENYLGVSQTAITVGLRYLKK